MSVLFGMWYGSAFPTYHGLQIMSVLMFFRLRTARLYDFAVIGPLMLISAAVANLPSMKPIWPNACGAIEGAYFFSIANMSVVSGPCFGSTRPNSLLIHRWPSKFLNCPAMKVLAIGV